MTTEFGVLEEVELRAAWRHEAHAFTPWLAEHLDRISEAIGVPLELEGSEVPVEGFSADILARNVADDTLVLIENQLEVADHGHLGQILTYLTGLKAQTVIWIAANFREPHLSAVKWLNEHTADPFAFFAVRVKVVRIGDSALAPVFEVLERPNEWDRKLQTLARDSGERSERGRFRQEFWAHLTARHPDYGRPDGYAGGTIADNIPGLDVAVVRYLGQNSVGVFVRGLHGSEPIETYERLAPHESRLTEATDIAMGARGEKYLFGKTLKVDSSDRDKWDRMADWLVEQARLYRDGLASVAGAAQ